MKPSVPKGTRDFSPAQVRNRDLIFRTIREVYVRYGYQPIETPAMENLESLTGKYGEEGDKLLFKVLNNGDYLAKADKKALEEMDSQELTSSISKRGLRYDLTVPFARYVVMHQNELTFPFKRYQIQPVWRADRPQKGRYQEFYQCDADVVGSDSLIYEAELIEIFAEVFERLGIQVRIKLNNRKILSGVAEVAGISEHFSTMTTAIDKLDKIGSEKVRTEMINRGVSDSAADVVLQSLKINDLAELQNLLSGSKIGIQGVEELQRVLEYTAATNVEFDLTLARGLSYYTGCILEVQADTSAYPDLRMGSIGGGGRYDDLTSIFGLKNVSGVGISFGAARIYDVMEELNLFPETHAEDLQLLFIGFDEASHRYAFNCLRQVRQAGINAEIYPEPTKLKKQMKYADARQVPFVALVGTEEMDSGQLSLKNMRTGEQEKLNLEEILKKLG